MKRVLVVALVACLMGAVSTQMITAEDKNPLEGLKCFMMPKKDVKEEKSVEYKDANVYFCCPGCVKKFAKDPEKYAAKANHQLVATMQYEQQGCPFSGGKLDDDTAIEVGGVEVKFCCNNCKGKAEKMEGDEQVEALFGEEAWEKGKFELVKKEDK